MIEDFSSQFSPFCLCARDFSLITNHPVYSYIYVHTYTFIHTNILIIIKEGKKKYIIYTITYFYLRNSFVSTSYIFSIYFVTQFSSCIWEILTPGTRRGCGARGGTRRCGNGPQSATVFYEHELHCAIHPDVYLVDKILHRKEDKIPQMAGI